MTRGDTLRLQTPELPNIEERPLTLASQLFLENCADRLTVLHADGSTRLGALDAVTMSQDGRTWRLTLKKGLRFHCGAEVTANDVAETLLRILRDTASASQLHRCVARDRARGDAFAVMAVSRYRLEITLIRRLDDFLVRLALPELGIRHEGRACFSGLWKVVLQDAGGLVLAVHDQHPDQDESPYRSVRWERLTHLPDLLGDGDAHVLLYPGTRFKSPPEELLADEICRPTDGGFSLLAKVHASRDQASEFRIRLAQATRLCFSKASLWRRSPLTALLPKGHVLHTAFLPEAPQVPGRRLELVLYVTTDLVPRLIWDVYCQVAREQLALDITLRELKNGETPPPNAAGTWAEVKAVYYAHPADYLTPLAQLNEFHVEKAKDDHRGSTPARRHVDFCQNLPRQHSYAPLLAVPFVVRANRNIRRRDDAALLRFADVRQSRDFLRKRQMQDTTLRALGSAMQTFVHDVRRPFSMVQGILGLLEAADGPERLKEIARKYLPDVRQAMQSADRLVQDLLEIGSATEPTCEDVTLVPLLESVLREIFTPRQGDRIEFTYRFSHQHRVRVDPSKIQRVTANLVVNAVEAMGGKGRIWFETNENKAAHTITVTVGNSDSYIPEPLISGIFDRFFTEGKKRGTGLGLAIVKKIVNDHGGTVRCESDRALGTRFSFSLPMAAAPESVPAAALPRCAADLAAAPDGASASETFALSSVLGQSGPVTVLLVDDDALYADMIQELLTPAEKTHGRIAFTVARSSDTALAVFRTTPTDVAIVDVDLGKDAEDGLTLVRHLRALAPGLRICVHSNGSPFELQRQVIEAGGDLFLPKPLAREHLLRLLWGLGNQDASRRRPRIAVVDDDALMLEMWESLPGYEWLSFESPAALLERIGAPHFAASLLCVVTDWMFPGSTMDGAQLATQLAKVAPTLPVFLATNRPHEPGKDAGFRRLVGKDAQKALEEIERILGTPQG